jgi:glycerol-3-phosphate dehydrogenase (NAD(P)+)
MPKIAILGAGSWGTALAIVLSRSPRQHEISLWARNGSLAAALQNDAENKTYLPGCRLPAAVQATDSLSSALDGAEIVVSAIPAAYVRAVFTSARPYLHQKVPVVSATKGLEPFTHLRMSEVLLALLAPNFLPDVAVLSGPSFAAEAARGEPTAAVVASGSPLQIATKGPALATHIQEEFAAPGFRLYTNDDIVGVELAGAMKNVIAIAAGACQGLGLGSNAVAALVTRGLAEMSRLAIALGAKPETLMGLAGLGDLVLTCTGTLSRNRHVGFELGKGRPLDEILAETRMVAEGVGTTVPLLALAAQHQVDLPITQQVDAILHRCRAPKDAIRAIMDRPQKAESA